MIPLFDLKWKDYIYSPNVANESYNFVITEWFSSELLLDYYVS